MTKRGRQFQRAALICLTMTIGTTSVAELSDAVIQIHSPAPYQVIQRRGYVPSESHEHAIGGPAKGFAELIVTGKANLPPESRLEARLSIHEKDVLSWRPLARVVIKDGSFEGFVRVPAGGWYALDIRATTPDGKQQLARVENVGVGEVFLIAGQSYATNTNDEMLVVNDEQKRVSAYDFKTKQWRIANDPQPTPDGTDAGSIWPPVGDQLTSLLDVPVGFANVAWGGTSSTQWMPDGELHKRLVEVGLHLRDFRAVLWQQGESDVIAKATRDEYIDRLKKIQAAAASAWTRSPHWLLAKSTLHPTVYNEPLRENEIRQAIDRLTRMPGFAPGPDTDLLGGINRGPVDSHRHFSAIGQRHAAQLWTISLWNEINRPKQEFEVALSHLDDAHLRDPIWNAPIVYRESSILLRDEKGDVTARLARPAKEILEVRAANGSKTFAPETDYILTNPHTLSFKSVSAMPPIDVKDLFPPIDAPGSYKHRAGHPEMGVLYGPGQWFHDRQIEITYRAEENSSLQWNGLSDGSARLPRTHALLAAGKPVKLVIAGDSISFGWDASRLCAAPPAQPPYPMLLAAQLQEDFHSPITYANRAISGWSIANGVQDIPGLLAEQPDLVVAAFGMNDVGRRDPKWFADQAKRFIDAIRSSRPEAEIILVAPMIGNREWVHTPYEMFLLYREELRKLEGAGIAVADVTSLWEALLRTKHDLDLTGNGLNHPNDFGHRLYAQVILSLLQEHPTHAGL